MPLALAEVNDAGARPRLSTTVGDASGAARLEDFAAPWRCRYAGGPDCGCRSKIEGERWGVAVEIGT